MLSLRFPWVNAVWFSTGFQVSHRRHQQPRFLSHLKFGHTSTCIVDSPLSSVYETLFPSHLITRHTELCSQRIDTFNNTCIYHCRRNCPKCSRPRAALRRETTKVELNFQREFLEIASRSLIFFQCDWTKFLCQDRVLTCVLWDTSPTTKSVKTRTDGFFPYIGSNRSLDIWRIWTEQSHCSQKRSSKTALCSISKRNFFSSSWERKELGDDAKVSMFQKWVRCETKPRRSWPTFIKELSRHKKNKVWSTSCSNTRINIKFLARENNRLFCREFAETWNRNPRCIVCSSNVFLALMLEQKTRLICWLRGMFELQDVWAFRQFRIVCDVSWYPHSCHLHPNLQWKNSCGKIDSVSQKSEMSSKERSEICFITSLQQLSLRLLWRALSQPNCTNLNRASSTRKISCDDHGNVSNTTQFSLI